MIDLHLSYLIFFGYITAGLLLFLFVPLRKRLFRILFGFLALPVFTLTLYGSFLLLEETFPFASELCLDVPSVVCETNFTLLYISMGMGLGGVAGLFFTMRKLDQQH